MERWDMLELTFDGKTDGNPFTDYEIYGTFTNENETKTVEGFYNGNGRYIVRFMPSFEGEYHYRIYGSFSDKEFEEDFIVTAPSENNHGPVRVSNTYHFSYADGTPYYLVGTTCYVWHIQSEQLKEQTLKSLEKAGFNKIRFCVFPKHYDYNFGEPPCYPFEGTPVDSSTITSENFSQFNGDPEGNNWDFSRFNPEYFRNIERCITELQKLGIEADIIIFHPYDRWGFSMMDMESDMRYLKYLTARLSAYRNVWWSLANEYDLLSAKTAEHWETFGNYLMNNDPYDHLRSIHNCVNFYDHTRPWITHCSIQRHEIFMTNEYREKYNKPIVLDEIAYEGNIQYGWGNITGEEMLRRFWEGALRGGYPGHGETYLGYDNVLWWSHGGELHGESHKRVKFLHEIMLQTPCNGLKLGNRDWDCVCGFPQDDDVAERTGYCIYYFSIMQPLFRDFYLDDDNEYIVEVIDTWEMTITEIGIFKGKFRVPLAGKQYMAVRVRKTDKQNGQVLQ